MSETRKESDLDLITLIFRYLSRKLNFQHFLYFLVFVTFNVGDAVTASIMMDMKGIGTEYNFLVQQIYVNFGLAGLIAAKLCLIVVPLMIASSEIKRSYWLINGILVALIMTGVMATRANLQEINGVSHMSPVEINIIYIQFLFILVMAGMILDHIISRDESKKTGI